MNTCERHPKMPRLWGWMAATVAASLAVAMIASQQTQVVLYKVSMINLGLVMAYWADRSLFARGPDRIEEGMPRDALAAARVIARALITLAVVLGVALGL